MKKHIRKILAASTVPIFSFGIRFGLEDARCPDDSFCSHSALCVAMESKTGAYGCDCKTALGISSYAGISCEYEATHYYFFNVPDGARKSFCTNGKCKEIYQADDGEE